MTRRFDFFRERESGTLIPDPVVIENALAAKVGRRQRALEQRVAARGLPRYIRRHVTGALITRSTSGHLTRRQRKIIARSGKLLHSQRG